MKNQLKAGILWLLLIVFDQIVKLWVLASLKGKEAIVLIKDVLELRYVENRGAAFGIFQNKQWFFVIVSIIVLIALILIARNIPDSERYVFLKISMYFIAAGAVGNMIDRIFRRYVVDFIYFKLIDFPVFNVADIYVTCAAILLILLLIFYYKDEELEEILSFRKHS